MMRLKLAMISALCVIALVGCDGDTRVPSDQRQHMSVQASQGGRVSVVKISEFRDGLAYDSVRGVYIITDKQTGKEFIGVSGVGIVDVGSHGCGKGCTARDER